MSFFEHYAADNEQERVGLRKAAALAHRRADLELGAFIRAANSEAEYESRVSFIHDDLVRIATDVADECGVDVAQVEAALEKWADRPLWKKKQDEIQKADSTHNKPPWLSDKSEELKEGDDEDVSDHQKEAGGAWCDECRVWKSGPKAGDCSHVGGESDGEEETEKEARTAAPELATEPIMTQQPLPDSEGEGVTDITEELEEAPSAVGDSTAEGVLSGTRTAEWEVQQLTDGSGQFKVTGPGGNAGGGTFETRQDAQQEADDRNKTSARHTAKPPETGDSYVEREKLPKGDESALGGPSPKTDHKTWKPNALNDSGNVEPIDSEVSNSPHPTEHNDIKQRPDYEKDKFLDHTENVADHDVDLAKDTGDFQADNTDTWTEAQNDPVTNESLEQATSASIDPDKNPIREILEAGSGWEPTIQVQAAIAAYEQRKKND